MILRLKNLNQAMAWKTYSVMLTYDLLVGGWIPNFPSSRSVALPKTGSTACLAIY